MQLLPPSCDFDGRFSTKIVFVPASTCKYNFDTTTTTTTTTAQPEHSDNGEPSERFLHEPIPSAASIVDASPYERLGIDTIFTVGYASRHGRWFSALHPSNTFSFDWTVVDEYRRSIDMDPVDANVVFVFTSIAAIVLSPCC